MSTKRQRFTKEFKKESVEYLINSGKRLTEVSHNLGIRHDLLSRWRKEYFQDGKDAFPGKGNQTPEQAELTSLKKELADVRMERDILKKAMAIFSKDQ